MRLPILVFHICAGILGMLSGAVAMSFRKGSPGHRAAGNTFVISMLCLAVSAVYLAIMKSQMMNVLGGVLTFYLVTSAWLTARRKAGKTGQSEWGLLLFASVVGSTLEIVGFQALRSATGLKYGTPAALFFIFGSLALVAAAGDIRVLVRGGIFGTERLVRHLWRMCFALFFATGSFFLGQQQVIPAFLRNTTVLFILAFLPLLLMIFWLIRVRFANAIRRMSLPRAGDISPRSAVIGVHFHASHAKTDAD